MSYASVAATNAPPPSEQPHPDQGLLNTTPPTHSLVADDAAKVNIVGPDFKDNPHTLTSEADRIFEQEETESPAGNGGEKARKPRQRIHEVQAEGLYIWETAKHYIIRPGVAGGLIGLVNIGLFGAMGRAFYLRPRLRGDVTAISSAVAASFALITLEGVAAEKYRQTPRGQEEERRAKREGALIFRHLREQIVRPGVLGGILGIVNAAILGTLGYMSYANWNKRWDRRTVSAIFVGLLTLWSGEGFVAAKQSRK